MIADTLAINHPEIAAELHPMRNPGIDPAQLAAQSGLKLWWRCRDCGHEWQAKVYGRTNGTGCPACRATRPGPRGQTFADARPDLVAEWHPTRNGELAPDTVSAHSDRMVWWCCAQCGGEWQATLGARCRSPRGGCRECAQTLLKRERHATGRSLAALHPELLAELHPTRNPQIDPTQLGPRSGVQLWWHCARCGNEWRTRVATRTGGSGCPACYHARRRKTAIGDPRRSPAETRAAAPARNAGTAAGDTSTRRWSSRTGDFTAACSPMNALRSDDALAAWEEALDEASTPRSD